MYRCYMYVYVLLHAYSDVHVHVCLHICVFTSIYTCYVYIYILLRMFVCFLVWSVVCSRQEALEERCLELQGQLQVRLLGSSSRAPSYEELPTVPASGVYLHKKPYTTE